MDVTEKTRENRLRRMAGRQLLTLAKSRTRDHRAADFDRYHLVHENHIIFGYENSDRMFTATLDEIEKFLTDDTRLEARQPGALYLRPARTHYGRKISYKAAE